MTDHVPTRIEIPGTFNFRDLGGWPTPSGTVGTGRLFRSDGLARLTDDSRTMLRDLGIGTVVDLRESKEAVGAPDALDGLDVVHHRMPLFGDRYYPIDADRPDRIVLTEHSLPHIYSAMIDHCGSQLAATIGVLADAEAPVVYHCSAGKDRTGIVSAFVLTVLGVEREHVLADYAATEGFLGADFLAAIRTNFASAGIVGNLAHTATQAPREYLERSLRRVEADHGSVEGYLVDHGLTTDQLDRLREVHIRRD